MNVRIKFSAIWMAWLLIITALVYGENAANRKTWPFSAYLIYAVAISAIWAVMIYAQRSFKPRVESRTRRGNAALRLSLAWIAGMALLFLINTKGEFDKDLITAQLFESANVSSFLIGSWCLSGIYNRMRQNP